MPHRGCTTAVRVGRRSLGPNPAVNRRFAVGVWRGGRSRVDSVDHFFVMVGQVLDDARIGGVVVRLTLHDGAVVEGVPSEPVADASRGDEIDDTGYGHRIEVAGASVDLATVRQATIVHPQPGR